MDSEDHAEMDGLLERLKKKLIAEGRALPAGL